MRKCTICAVVFLVCTPAFALPAAFDDAHNLRVDSQPYFVLGVFDAYPKSALTDIAGLGFNTVEVPVGYVDTDYLDEAQRLGLGVIVWFGGYGPTYVADVLKFVEANKAHPALLGNYTIDEPANFDLDPADFHAVYQSLKSADPDHIVVSAFNTLPEDGEYKDGVDAFGIDPYPVQALGQPGGDLAMAATETDAAHEATAGTKPVWDYPQAFGENSAWARPPDATEYRLLCYLPILHGAKGMMAYTYAAAGFKGISNTPSLREGAQRVNAELAQLGPPVLENRRAAAVHGAVHLAVFVNGFEAYLVAANTAYFDTYPSVALPAGRLPRTVGDAFSGQPATVQNGRLNLHLEPCAVAVVRMEWDGQVPDVTFTDVVGFCGRTVPNRARPATVSATSTIAPKYGTAKANDGRTNSNWASVGGYTLPQSLRIDLAESTRLTTLVATSPEIHFYDNWKDIRISFSDGSTEELTLPNTGLAKTVTFPARLTSWIEVAVLSTYTTTSYVGCSELELYYEPVGDVNADGRVNAVDVQLAVNKVLGFDIMGYKADVNADSSINAQDIQIVVNALLNQA